MALTVFKRAAATRLIVKCLGRKKIGREMSEAAEPPHTNW
jgi:hypothetical protein